MVSQHALTLDVTEDASSFDFFDPLAYPTADPLGHIWPHLALPVPQLRLASDIGSIDSIFARNNSVTFSPAVAVASTVEYPFTFELNGVDKDAGTGSDEGGYVDPRVGFESMPPSPTIAIGDIEQKDSNDVASEFPEYASATAGDSLAEPPAIAPMPLPLPLRRSPRSKRLASPIIPRPLNITSERRETRKISLKRKRVDEVSSTSTVLASGAQGDNNILNPVLQPPARNGPVTRRRKVADGVAIPVVQSTRAAHDSRHPARPPLPQLLEISEGFERPPFSSTHKRRRGGIWTSTACLMCGVPRRRRKLNDTAHTHRSAVPGNKRRMPWCECMQAIGVRYPAAPGSDYKHTNMPNFGLVLLSRYPELIDVDFEHDQITGVAAIDLKSWWATCEDLQKAHKEGRLPKALEDAASEVKV